MLKNAVDFVGVRLRYKGVGLPEAQPAALMQPGDYASVMKDKWTNLPAEILRPYQK